MIVEDDKFFMDLLAKRLSASGLSVIHAHNGEEAISLNQSEKPSVILLDVLLPEKDGFAVLAELKGNESSKGTPVILLSNLGSKENLEKAKALKAYNFLIKATVSLDQVMKETMAALSGAPARM